MPTHSSYLPRGARRISPERHSCSSTKLERKLRGCLGLTRELRSASTAPAPAAVTVAWATHLRSLKLVDYGQRCPFSRVGRGKTLAMGPGGLTRRVSRPVLHPSTQQWLQCKGQPGDRFRARAMPLARRWMGLRDCRSHRRATCRAGQRGGRRLPTIQLRLWGGRPAWRGSPCRHLPPPDTTRRWALARPKTVRNGRRRRRALKSNRRETSSQGPRGGGGRRGCAAARWRAATPTSRTLSTAHPTLLRTSTTTTIPLSSRRCLLTAAPPSHNRVPPRGSQRTARGPPAVQPPCVPTPPRGRMGGETSGEGVPVLHSVHTHSHTIHLHKVLFPLPNSHSLFSSPSLSPPC
eukprot:Hpha_TRINITY_DN16678_c2_g2::TRINITY_DN16678_c2_g2_i1::g.183887::m.183887